MSPITPMPMRSSSRFCSSSGSEMLWTWKLSSASPRSANIGRILSATAAPSSTWLAAMSRNGMLLSPKWSVSTAITELRSWPSRSPTP